MSERARTAVADQACTRRDPRPRGVSMPFQTCGNTEWRGRYTGPGVRKPDSRSNSVTSLLWVSGQAAYPLRTPFLAAEQRDHTNFKGLFQHFFFFNFPLMSLLSYVCMCVNSFFMFQLLFGGVKPIVSLYQTFYFSKHFHINDLLLPELLCRLLD